MWQEESEVFEPELLVTNETNISVKSLKTEPRTKKENNSFLPDYGFILYIQLYFTIAT